MYQNLGSAFGFWEVLLDSGTCFYILGSAFGFRDVFWILEIVLGSGNCFGSWEVFCPYKPPYDLVKGSQYKSMLIHVTERFRSALTLVDSATGDSSESDS